MANRRNDRPSVSDSRGNLTYIRGSLRCLVKGDGSVHRICVFRRHLGQPAPGFHFEGWRIWFHMPPSLTAGTMGPRCFNPRISKKKVGFYLLTHTHRHTKRIQAFAVPQANLSRAAETSKVTTKQMLLAKKAFNRSLGKKTVKCEECTYPEMHSKGYMHSKMEAKTSSVQRVEVGHTFRCLALCALH